MFVTRSFVAVGILASLAVTAGCADGGDGGRRDSGGGALDGGDSGGGGLDAFVPPDTGTPDTGIGSDSGPDPTLLTCESCTDDSQCIDGYCAHLVSGGNACLPGCVPDLPSCPRSFSCIFDASGTGVDATICAPVGGPCCVDEDGDGYGQGVGCTDTDCNDTDPEVHPDRIEICDGRDTNCNGTIDETPTNCEGGICRLLADATYEQVTSAVCTAASCGMGTAAGCGLYTCSAGGEDGTSCATQCANPDTGADDDTFCIATAHCDGGACVANVPDGGTCDEDTDCSASHCDSDICCSSGDCCTTAAQCPGGGGVTRLCTDPTMCQGSRGEATCGTDFRCAVASGIADDTACDTTVVARDCGLFDPIVCNGSATQTARACPTSCVGDADCIDLAHCSVGFCVPDLPPGGSCGRNADCQDGLSCADSVCCTTSCTGSCQSCNLPGTAGNCTNIPMGADPGGECVGFSCAGYYTGFGGTDVCSRRTDVSDSQAACDGGGACRSPDVMCPAQPAGVQQIDCDNTCQTPAGGTCSGTTAGICNNVTTGSTTCGMGACARTVAMCTSGAPTACMPGTPVTEICNAVDDDCDGSVNEGTAAEICPSTAQVASSVCMGSPPSCSVAAGGCASGYADIDAVYGNGCECAVGTNISCAVAQTLGSFSAGNNGSVSSAVPAGGERWFTATFPVGARGPSGVPHIQLTAGAATHSLQVTTTCTATTTTVCSVEGGSSGATTNWEFQDNASPAGAGAYSTNAQVWPTTVYIRVTRLTPATNCAAAGFTLSVSR